MPARTTLLAALPASQCPSCGARLEDVPGSPGRYGIEHRKSCTAMVCACGAPWSRIDMHDGLGPVWMVRHVGGRDQCRALPPPKPSEVIPGATILRWNPSVGTTYAHDCGGELLVSDILGTGQLELVCDCGLSPLELAVQFQVPLARLHPIDLDVSRTMISERAEEDPDTLALLALLDAHPLQKVRG